MNGHGPSRTCSRCVVEGKRVNRELFKCPRCGYEISADFSGAKNILNRVKVALGNIPTGRGLEWTGSKPFRDGLRLCNASGETEKEASS